MKLIYNPEVNPLSYVIIKETHEALVAAFNALPNHFKTILHDHIIDEKSLVDIGVKNNFNFIETNDNFNQAIQLLKDKFIIIYEKISV